MNDNLLKSLQKNPSVVSILMNTPQYSDAVRINRDWVHVSLQAETLKT